MARVGILELNSELHLEGMLSQSHAGDELLFPG